MKDLPRNAERVVPQCVPEGRQSDSHTKEPPSFLWLEIGPSDTSVNADRQVLLAEVLGLRERQSKARSGCGLGWEKQAAFG